MTIGLILVALLVVTVLFAVATRAIEGSSFTIAQVGFGKVTPSAISTGWSIGMTGSAGHRILSSILVANLPQTIFSFLYLNLNGLLTTMLLASGWRDFATDRKTLRVSKPKGTQRSTHFLHLPYKVAVPVMVMSGLLHWMISQALSWSCSPSTTRTARSPLPWRSPPAASLRLPCSWPPRRRHHRHRGLGPRLRLPL
jgi:hypothetical protein